MRARGLDTADRSLVLAMVAASAAGAFIMAAVMISTLLWPTFSGAL
jgi:hypothetical protein